MSYINDNGIEANESPNWVIQNSIFSRMSAIAGIGISGDGHYRGINAPGANSLIQYNQFYNCGYIPILFFRGNTTIQYNYIDTFCTILDDGGGIYTGLDLSAGKVIKSNIVLNGIGAPDGTSSGVSSAMGIYVDDNCSNVNILNNTVANCTGFGSEIHNSSDIQIIGNTYYNNGTDVEGGQIIFFHESGNNLIRNIVMTDNKFVSRTSNQTMMMCYTDNNDTRNFFSTLDSNIYTRPIKETDFFYISETSSWITLAQWKTFIGQDVHSKKAPRTISNINDLRFEYNTTSSNKVINLGANYISIDSITYNGTITLAPYTSAVLIYVSGVVANQPPVANAGPDQSFFLPTVITTLTGSW